MRRENRVRVGGESINPDERLESATDDDDDRDADASDEGDLAPRRE